MVHNNTLSMLIIQKNNQPSSTEDSTILGPKICTCNISNNFYLNFIVWTTSIIQRSQNLKATKTSAAVSIPWKTKRICWSCITPLTVYIQRIFANPYTNHFSQKESNQERRYDNDECKHIECLLNDDQLNFNM